jgi:hypothetical protein
MQGGLGLRDLHLGRGKAHFASSIGQPASKKRLATPVLATDRFEHAATGADFVQFFIPSCFEAIQPHSKGIEAMARHRTTPQSL